MKKFLAVLLISFFCLFFHDPVSSEMHKAISDDDMIRFSEPISEHAVSGLESKPILVSIYQTSDDEDYDDDEEYGDDEEYDEDEDYGYEEDADQEYEDEEYDDEEQPLPPSEPNTDEEETPIEIENAEVELFITSWCKYCKKAREYFESKGISITEYDIEKDKEAATIKESLDHRPGVPFAIVNGQHIHGYSEAAYERALKGEKF